MFIIFTLILLFTSLSSSSSSSSSSSISEHPTPTPWPEQFHAVQFVNISGSLYLFDLWYDYPNGRNFNIQRPQLSNEVRYDLEWNNGTSYYYTLDSNKKCKTLHFPVGILPPDWLKGADYLGQVYFDGFLCNVWEKVDFIWYYEDVVTKRPVYWRFYNGMTEHMMTFEVGAVLEDSKWQAPEYCFKNNNEEKEEPSETLSIHVPHRLVFTPGGFLRKNNLPPSRFDKTSL